MFFQLGTGRALAMEMERAGFESILDERLTTTLPYPDEASAADAAFVGGPVALAYSRFSDEVRSVARKEYLASISSFRSEDGYRIPGEFVIASARKPWI
jgi:hypothetical protein